MLNFQVRNILRKSKAQFNTNKNLMRFFMEQFQRNRPVLNKIVIILLSLLMTDALFFKNFYFEWIGYSFWHFDAKCNKNHLCRIDFLISFESYLIYDKKKFCRSVFNPENSILLQLGFSRTLRKIYWNRWKLGVKKDGTLFPVNINGCDRVR